MVKTRWAKVRSARKNQTTGRAESFKKATGKSEGEFSDVHSGSGDKKAFAEQHRAWKKHIQGVSKHHGLTDAEQASLFLLNCTAGVKDALDIFEVADYDDPKILKQVWQVLDDQRAEFDNVRADAAYKSWETTNRKHGKSMHTWILNFKNVDIELEAHDSVMVLSPRMHVSKLMRGSGFSHDKRAQALFNAGGEYDPDKLPSVSRSSHKDLQDQDDQRGKTNPMKVRVKKS